jgi:hypothetical protein
LHWYKVIVSAASDLLTVSLAYAELYLGLSMLLREFDFRVVTGEQEMALIDVFATFFNTRKVELELKPRVDKA